MDRRDSVSDGDQSSHPLGVVAVPFRGSYVISQCFSLFFSVCKFDVYLYMCLNGVLILYLWGVVGHSLMQ